ncbi:protein split ends isoform X6 [Drosophila mojavensis]|uniref:protein split ends isoform X6 n=1 Tax=Drosophila mojavensis TaxID=7230 RepID=UPI001CD144CB|nr:protein split ends isoform X6 [Drosophila mojavensis]
MIEIDEQITKPLNLANSAVLRAVEEEDQQIKCGDFYARPRQSRSRQRGGIQETLPPHHAPHQQLLDQIKSEYLSHQHDVVIDRETVLRINRLSTRRQLPKRDHSWPPAEQEALHSPSVTPSITPTHSIDVLREKFNSPTRIVEPTARELRQQRRQLEPKQKQQQQQQQQRPRQSRADVSSSRTPEESASPSPATPQARGFSAPETKAADADLGLVAPKCEYYEQLTQQRPATPTAKVSTPSYRPRLKRQSYSLDRGRARKRAVALGAATELPPPKPRNGSGNGTPKVQRRSIKLATELRISYDTDHGNDGDSEEEPKVTLAAAAAAAATAADIDLESLPLPATPSERAAAAAAASAAAKLMTQTQNASLPRQGSTSIDSLALKQQQQMALALAAATPDGRAQSERIIPITVLAETPRSGQQEASAQDPRNAMTDDAAAPPATYVSATSGIKLQRQDSSGRCRTQLSRASSIPTPPPLPPPPAAPLLQLRARSRQEAKDMQARRQGGIYEQVDPQLASSQVKQHEAHVEIAQLEAKYAHIQQSIAEHLRQIDAYMENAKTALQRTAQVKLTAEPPAAPPLAPPKPLSSSPSNSNHNELWDLFASRQSPILAVESPLQAILRQIYCRAAGIQLQPKEQQDSPVLQQEPAVPAENVPIVERALEDLHRIAIALDSDGHVEHKTTPKADKAQHVVIEEETEAETETEAEQQELKLEQNSDFNLDYRHVSDVIANYEQLSAATANRQEQQPDKRNAPQLEEQLAGRERRAVKCQEQHESKKADTKSEVKSIREAEEEALQQEKILKEIRKEQQREKLRELLQKQEKQLKEQVELLREQQKEKLKTEQQEKLKMEQQELLKIEQQQQQSSDQVEAKHTATPSCPHEPSEQEQQAKWCAVCGECRDSPHGWGKLNKADQWRLDNLQNESLANYKSTYEIRSPYISRQISWEDTQQQQQGQQEQQPQGQQQDQGQSREPLQRQRSEVEIVTTPIAAEQEEEETTPTATPATAALAEPKEWQLSRSPSPLPLRKYPAPLIETAQRCSSPFGLNAVQLRSSTPSPAPLEAKFTHVPQLEGHNIGLLVHTATEPLQMCMSASSSMLAATPPATPRCNSQPPPFEFLVQHGLGVEAQRDAQFTGFKSLAGSSEELPRERSVNRSFDNVSPRPYMGIEGYKRVAWPPASEERIVREFTPQPQTQSPAPGSGGYYPQPAASQAASANAAPAQGPIYNNVQPRTQQHPQPKPQPQQQQRYPPHQQPAQNVYGPATNYAAAATVAAAAAPANTYNYPQQPIQYTQAQFNRQRSREPTVEAQFPSYPQQQQQQQQQQQLPPQQQQQQYQPSYQQQQQQPLQTVNNVGGGWKHIGPPKPKTHRDFVAGGVAPYQQQQQQYQQQQQPPQQQYGAPSYNNYQQQQQQPQQQWQQHQQQQHQQQPQQQQYQAPYQTSPYQQQQNYPQQNGGANYAQPQYNSYSQPQQQQQQQQVPYSLDQTDQHGYRGASPGIITLRKEAPVSQKPAPVYTSQPAAVSYRGGSKLRGDLKWPPQEYKEAAVRENEERRLLALGPVCRPRRVNRDYTPFFAKHQLNHSYPSYKVPPGTQHIFGA